MNFESGGGRGTGYSDISAYYIPSGRAKAGMALDVKHINRNAEWCLLHNAMRCIFILFVGMSSHRSPVNETHKDFIGILLGLSTGFFADKQI